MQTFKYFETNSIYVRCKSLSIKLFSIAGEQSPTSQSWEGMEKWEQAMTAKTNNQVAEANEMGENIFYLMDRMCKIFEHIDNSLASIAIELELINDNIEASR